MTRGILKKKKNSCVPPMKIRIRVFTPDMKRCFKHHLTNGSSDRCASQYSAQNNRGVHWRRPRASPGTPCKHASMKRMPDGATWPTTSQGGEFRRHRRQQMGRMSSRQRSPRPSRSGRTSAVDQAPATEAQVIHAQANWPPPPRTNRPETAHAPGTRRGVANAPAVKLPI
jgi:hypothetical protein